MPKYTVIRDTREQENHGWFFDKSGDCEGMITRGLKTADYSLQGYEVDVLALERKRNTSEFATNLTQDRFERELERLESFRFPFIICEFSLTDVLNFPNGSGIPKWKWKDVRVSPLFLLKRICELQVKYKTRIIFADNPECAKKFVLSLFKRVVEICPV